MGIVQSSSDNSAGLRTVEAPGQRCNRKTRSTSNLHHEHINFLLSEPAWHMHSTKNIKEYSYGNAHKWGINNKITTTYIVVAYTTIITKWLQTIVGETAHPFFNCDLHGV